MSIQRELQQVIREEVEAALAPIRDQIERLNQHSDLVSRLTAAFGTKVRAKLPRPRTISSGALCAIIGCNRPSRSKGYCSAHYQKRRMLRRTRRLPAGWVEDAAPNSVPNLTLPRGRPSA